MKINVINTIVTVFALAPPSANSLKQTGPKQNLSNKLNLKNFNYRPQQIKERSPLYLDYPPKNTALSTNNYQHNQVKPTTSRLFSFNSDSCQIEPDITLEPFYSKPIKQVIVERTFITALSTMLLALILPTIKGIGLAGKVTFNPNIGKSMRAIGPIVTFTVNAPQLLNTIWNNLLPSDSNNEKYNNLKILTLAILKHLWIWAPENNLNALSSNIGKSTSDTLINIFTRKSAHTLREALLIKCVSKNECKTIIQKMKSYAELALLQTIFDRIAFKTAVNPIYTILSRFFYLMAVKEVIDFSSHFVHNLEENITVLKRRQNNIILTNNLSEATVNS